MHGDGGWWIVMVPLMVLFMGGMMWMMLRGMIGGSSPGSSTPSETPGTRETPSEILERRFAEGEISIEEYRARREVLMSESTAPSRDEDQQPMATHPA
jgi:putative membrane protein